MLAESCLFILLAPFSDQHRRIYIYPLQIAWMACAGGSATYNYFSTSPQKIIREK